MSERPILFSGAMVRAILEGRKSQTRRVVKPQPTNMDDERRRASVLADGQRRYGDLLWVRETWGRTCDCPANVLWKRKYLYAATDAQYSPERWRPSIHMPRAASRLTLRVTDVRVQRVQEISTEDIMAEGVTTALREYDAEVSLRIGFCALWDSINGRRAPWESNPWVWAVTFEVTR